MKLKRLMFPLSKIAFLGVLLLTIVSLMMLLSSCKREYSPIPLPPSVSVAEFAPTSGTFLNSYYIKNTNAPFLIPVGFTGFSNTDRTISFTVTSKTAVAGQQFSAPAPVTIKAGQVLDTLRFQGLFSGYTGSRIDTITIKLGGYPTVNGQDTIRLVLRPYCDVIAANLTGDYAHTSDYQSPYGTSATPYTTTIYSWTPVTGSTTSATVLIKNIGLSSDIGFGGAQKATDPVVTGIMATVDWSDPSNFKLTIPAQNYIMATGSYGVSTIQGTGVFSSCDQKFILTYTIKVSAGSFGTFVTTMVR